MISVSPAKSESQPWERDMSWMLYLSPGIMAVTYIYYCLYVFQTSLYDLLANPSLSNSLSQLKILYIKLPPLKILCDLSLPIGSTLTHYLLHRQSRLIHNSRLKKKKMGLTLLIISHDKGRALFSPSNILNLQIPCLEVIFNSHELVKLYSQVNSYHSSRDY